MMKVYLLDTGTLLADKGGIVYRGGDAPKETVRLPVPAVLIDHPQGKILYDTGCHPDAMKGYWPQNMQRAFPLTQEPSQRLERQLALCNTCLLYTSVLAIEYTPLALLSREIRKFLCLFSKLFYIVLLPPRTTRRNKPSAGQDQDFTD